MDSGVVLLLAVAIVASCTSCVCAATESPLSAARSHVVRRMQLPPPPEQPVSNATDPVTHMPRDLRNLRLELRVKPPTQWPVNELVPVPIVMLRNVLTGQIVDYTGPAFMQILPEPDFVSNAVATLWYGIAVFSKTRVILNSTVDYQVSFHVTVESDSSRADVSVQVPFLVTAQVCREGSIPAINAADGDACRQCEIGTYHATPLATNCTRCPPRQTTRGSGASSLQDCECMEGWFSIDQQARSDGSRIEGSGGTTGLGETAIECNICPRHATCPNGVIVSNPGFARISSSSVNVLRCPSPDACLGGDVCAEGHEGVLCMVCSEGYGMVFDGTRSCAPCVSMAAVPYIAMFFILSLCITLFFALIRFSIVSHPAVVGAIKILINFVQMAAMLGPMQQSQALRAVLTVMRFFLSPAIPSIPAVDCLFNFGPSETIILNMVTPLVAVVVFLILEGLIRLLRRSSASCSKLNVIPTKHRSLGMSLTQQCAFVFIVMQMVVWPEQLFSLLGAIVCHNFDGRWVLVNYPARGCAEASPYSYLSIVGFIAVFVWYAAIALTLRHFYKQARPFQRSLIFRFFQCGYRPQYFYWDLVLSLRKHILVILLSVGLGGVSWYLDAMYIFVLSVCVMTNIFIQPFELKMVGPFLMVQEQLQLLFLMLLALQAVDVEETESFRGVYGPVLGVGVGIFILACVSQTVLVHTRMKRVALAARQASLMGGDPAASALQYVDEGPDMASAPVVDVVTMEDATGRDGIVQEVKLHAKGVEQGEVHHNVGVGVDEDDASLGLSSIAAEDDGASVSLTSSSDE